ncbi:hypothetical protein R1flu_004567 [Riccia fluitans]|uniref:Response regulatory domain-containing protein n=1 Tax=Riccia fluitans TaxID=41844 RepID=A0ABD1YQY9_9MARC
MSRKISRPATPDIEDGSNIESDMTVLVVDDHLMHRVVLRQMLTKLKCEVMEADSGKAAVAANSKEQFDAIFMDINMPLMDGCHATRLIRESNRPKTPVIGVCTKCDEDMRKRCINAGMNQLLVKPLVMSQLVSLLRRLKSAQNQDISIDGLAVEKTQLPGGAIEEVYTEHEKPRDPSKEATTSNPVKDSRRRDSQLRKGKEQRRESEQIRQHTMNFSQSKYGTTTVAAADAPVVLTMKVLVGMGQVAMLSVGGGPQLPSGKPRWEYFMVDVPVLSVTGAQELRKPMEQLRLCEQVATPGSVIMSPEVWAHCQTYCEAKDLADGFVQLVHVKTHSFTRPPLEVPYDVRRVPVAINILKRVRNGKLLCTCIGSKKRCEYTAFGNCINLSARLMKKANNEVLIDMDTYRLTNREFEVEALPPMNIKGRKGPIDVYRVTGSKISRVGVKTVRRSSADGASTSSPGILGSDLRTTLCGRKVEMDFLMSKIHAFIASYSKVSSSEHTNQALKADALLQAAEVGDTCSNRNVLDEAREVNPSVEHKVSVVKQFGYTVIVIIGDAGMGKTTLMQAAGSDLKGLPVQMVDVGGASNNMLVYGVWVKLLLDLIPFDPMASPEERGIIVLKHLHSDLREKAYLLKDVLKVQFKDSSPGNGMHTGREKSEKLRRSISEKVFVRKGSSRRISFISTLAAKGALLVSGRSSRIDTESESGSQTSVSLDSAFASEMESAKDSDAEDVRLGRSSYSESPHSVETQLVTTEGLTENADFLAKKRSSIDSTSEMDINDSEVLSLLSSSPDTAPKSAVTETNSSGFHRDRRRSSTEMHLSKTSSPEVKVHWLGQLLLDLLLATAKKPLVVFLEDAHLMDNPSWSLLRRLSEEKKSGILVVAACRPMGKHAPKEFSKIIEAKSTLQLHLKELDALSTETLVRRTIISALNSDISIPSQVFRAISRRTQGHPLFSEQMAMALVELTLKSADNLKGSPNALRMLDLDTFNFSHSMEALITSRVDLLEPNHGLVLKVASVMGLSFSVHELQPIICQQLQRENTACLDMTQLNVILHGLEKLNFIVHHPTDPEGVYSFSNSVSRDVIYEMLPIKQRRTIHADVAEELLKQANSSVHCVTIAEHYTMACRDVEEMEIDLTAIAIDHWEEAASNALFKLGQYKLAIQYYENAISLGRIVHDHIHPQRIARWHYYLGQAFSALGKIEDSFRNAVMALDYMGENHSDKQQGSTGCSSSLTAEISSWTSQCRIGALRWLTGRVENEQDLLFTCGALALLSSLLISKDEVSTARKVTKRYVTVAKSASRLQPLELARAYVLNAVVAKSASHAKYKYQRSLDILRIQPMNKQPAIQTGDTHFYLGILYQFRGKWVRAQKHILEAERMYKTSQGRRQLDACRCLSASGHFFQGQVETALGLTTRVQEHEHEHPQLLFWSGFMVVACLDSLKRYKESAQVLARLKEKTCPLEHLALQIKALGWVSAIHVGDYRAAAQEAIVYVPQLLEIEPVSPAFSLAYASAAEVLLNSLEKQDMPDEDRIVKEKLVERVVKFFKAASNRLAICYSDYRFYEARLTLIRGNKGLAISLFEEAMKQALKLKMVPQATRAGDWLETCSRSPSNGDEFK